MVLVPLMISNLVSFYISKRLQPYPIYVALSLQDGIHLPSSETRNEGSQLMVSHAMRQPTEVMSAQLSISEACHKARSSEFRTWPVISDLGVVGVINSSALERAVGEGPGDRRLDELFDMRSFPHVHLDHSLYWALERMGTAKLDLLPVVSRDNMNRMEGIVTLKDVLRTYGFGPYDADHGNNVDHGGGTG